MKLVLASIIALLVLAALWVLLPLDEWIEAALRRIDEFWPWSLLVYLVVVFLLICVTVPSTPLNLGAGLAFGFGAGFAVALVGGWLASLACFLIARYLAGDWIRARRREGNEYTRAVTESVEKDGFKMILLARLVPFVPSSFKNYGFGITKVRFGKYAAASLLGQAPIVAAHAYLGAAGARAITGNGASDEEVAIRTWVLALGAVATVVFLVSLSVMSARRLKRTSAMAGEG